MTEATGLVVPQVLCPGASSASLTIVQMIQVMIMSCGKLLLYFLYCTWLTYTTVNTHN